MYRATGTGRVSLCSAHAVTVIVLDSAIAHVTYLLTFLFIYLYEDNQRPMASFNLSRPSQRPSHTWLRAVKDDLKPLNFGLATAWRKPTTVMHYILAVA